MIHRLLKKRYLSGAAAILVVLLGWAIYARLSERRLRVDLEQAASDRKAGNSRAARDRLARLVERWPGRAEVLFPLGESELACGRVEQAMIAWSQIPPKSPFAGQVALGRARLALEAGQFSNAEQILREALAESGSSSGELRHLLLVILMQRGALDEARQLIEARWREPGLSYKEQIDLLRAHMAVDLDTIPLESNLELLGRSGAAQSDDAGLWMARANLAVRTGKPEEARPWLDAAILSRGADPQVWRAQLEWSRSAGRLDRAVEAMTHLGANDLQAPEVARLGAWIAERNGDRKSERRLLEEAVSLDPGDLISLERLAELAFDEGRRDEGRRLRARKSELDAIKDRYRRLFRKGDLDTNALEMARLAAALGRDFEARALLTVVTQKHPDNSIARDELNRLGKPLPAGREKSSESLAKLFAGVINRSSAPAPATATATARKENAPSSIQFQDDAAPAGLADFVVDNGATPNWQLPETACGGVGFIDYDGDGFLDVFAIQGGRFPPPQSKQPPGDRLFRNRGNGTFEDVSIRAGLRAMTGGYGHGVSVGDFDNDGHADLFLSRWRSYVLYRSRGDGTFDDVTAKAGLAGDRDWPTSSAFADLDNDGDLDLYVCHYGVWNAEHPMICKDPTGTVVISCDPRSIAAVSDHVFRNDGGRFVDVTAEAGIIDRDGRGLGVVAADFDGDNLTDLFVANDSTANYLFHNRGGFRFEEVGQQAGVAANASGGYQAGMGVACGDSNRDGLIDLAVTNFYSESTSLFLNLGHGLFADRTAAVGLAAPSRYLLGFGAAFLDADNDGQLDLMTANGHVNDMRPQFPFQMTAQLFRGESDGRLTDVTSLAGVPFQQLHVGRGLAVGDLDNDGRVDAVMVAQNEPLVYFHNRTESVSGHFVTIQLEGTKSNRDGVGAVVTIKAGGKQQVRQRFGGGSYQSASDHRLHFGLAKSERIESVDVHWPSGQIDHYENLPVDKFYRFKEGNSAAKAASGARRRPQVRRD